MVDELLRELTSKGIRLWVDGAGIRYDAPRESMTPLLMNRIREHRAELLTRIGQPTANTPAGPPGRVLLRTLTTAPAAPVVFLIPGAGIGPRLFDSWRDASQEIELVSIHLPGRDALLDDPPFTDVAALADAIASQMLAYGDRQRVILGLSVGALIGREVAKLLGPEALQLLAVVAHVPPDRVADDLTRSDQELLDELHFYASKSGQPAPDAGKLTPFLPAFRADLKIRASCHATLSPSEQIAVPILGCFGATDGAVTVVDHEAWRPWTKSQYRIRIFDGDHFFARSQGEEVIAEILDFLAERQVQTALPPGWPPAVGRTPGY